MKQTLFCFGQLKLKKNVKHKSQAVLQMPARILTLCCDRNIKAYKSYTLLFYLYIYKYIWYDINVTFYAYYNIYIYIPKKVQCPNGQGLASSGDAALEIPENAKSSKHSEVLLLPSPPCSLPRIGPGCWLVAGFAIFTWVNYISTSTRSTR